jgi:MFS transporter, DHA2 family, multidrug resistance protein
VTLLLDRNPPVAVAASVKRRWWALGALALAVLAVGVEGTVLSVALPTLSRVLHASESDLQWFSSGYFLVLAAAMLPAGLLGDRYGHKKVLLISLALFGVGSARCAYSRSVAEFMAARVLVGFSYRRRSSRASCSCVTRGSTCSPRTVTAN